MYATVHANKVSETHGHVYLVTLHEKDFLCSREYFKLSCPFRLQEAAKNFFIFFGHCHSGLNGEFNGPRNIAVGKKVLRQFFFP